MFEIMKSKQIKEIYVMQLPQAPDDEASVRLWYAELQRLKEYLEKFFGVRHHR
jgi:benzoyl-CoA reductase/2-hydroxyglutaryl-CoA dehydratase subunit BcrC/BadD/HgdB